MHHHGSTVANKDSVDCASRQQAGERVVVTRNHRKLAAFDLRAEKIFAAHNSPHSLRSELIGEGCRRDETSLSIALVPVKNDQVPDLNAALEGSRIDSRCKSSALKELYQPEREIPSTHLLAFAGST
jgi:hypothetical protein